VSGRIEDDRTEDLYSCEDDYGDLDAKAPTL